MCRSGLFLRTPGHGVRRFLDAELRCFRLRYLATHRFQRISHGDSEDKKKRSSFLVIFVSP